MTDGQQPETSGLGNNGLPQGVEKVKLNPETSGHDIFGFRLAGSRTRGVYVTTIIGGTDVEKDGKLKTGDQLLQCDEQRLTGMTSDQVAKILRMAFAIHGYTELIVSRQWARSKGHAYRPLTPFSLSKSDQNIVSTGVIHEAPRKRSTVVEVHSYQGDKETMVGRSVTMDVLTNQTNHEEEEFNELPNVPRDSPSRRSVDSCLKKKSQPATDKSASAEVERRKMFSPKKYAEVRPDDNGNSEGSDLTIDKMSPLSSPEEDDSFQTARNTSRKGTASSVKGILATAQGGVRRSMRGRKTPSSDELPLVPLDQFSESREPTTSSSQTGVDENKGRRSAESLNSDGSGRSHMSGTASDGSNEFSWHCPVCLDGAKRTHKPFCRRRLRRLLGPVYYAEFVPLLEFRNQQSSYTKL